MYVCVQCMSVLSIRRRGLSSDRNSGSVWRLDLLLASSGKVVCAAHFHQPKPEISHLLQHTEYFEGLFFCILPEFSVHLILIIADLLFLNSFLFIFLIFDCPLFATPSIFVRLFRSGKKYLTLGSPLPPVPRLFSPPRPETPNDKRASQHLIMEQVKQNLDDSQFFRRCV